MKIGSLNSFSLKKTDYNSQNPVKNGHSKNVGFGAYELIKTFKDPHYTWMDNFVYELSNKLKVVIIPKKGPDAVTFKTVVKTGALNEQDNVRGISHLLEHLLFTGSKGLKHLEFNQSCASKGGASGAQTSTLHTAYYFKVTNAKNNDMSELIKKHSDLIKYPILSKTQFDKEKLIVLHEISTNKDEIDEIAYFELLKKMFRINSQAHDLVLGNENTIKSITRKDVLEYHKKNYTPDNMEIHVVGPTNHQKIINQIDKNFNTPDFVPSSEPKYHEKLMPIEKADISIIPMSTIYSSQVRAGFIGPSNINMQEAHSLQILTDILNARFNKKLKEISSTSNIGFIPVGNHPSDNLMFFFDVRTERGKEQKVLNSLKEVINDIEINPVDSNELELVKMNSMDYLNRGAEVSRDISKTLEYFVGQGSTDSYENMLNRIKNLTSDDIRLAAQKYLKTDKMAVIVVCPETKKAKKISFSGNTVVKPNRIKKHILKNNLKLFINDEPEKIRTAMTIKIESDYEPKLGTGLILSKTLENCTSKHDYKELMLLKFQECIEDIQASPVYHGIELTTNTMSEKFLSALNLAKQMLFEPNLNKENVHRAKDMVISDLLYTPLSAAEKAMEIMYPNHILGLNTDDLLEAIEKITLTDVRKYYQELMNNGIATVVLTGPVSKTEGLQEKIINELSSVENAFSNYSINQKPCDIPKNNHVAIQIAKGFEQSEIVQLFNIDTQNIKDIAAMEVLNAILGSAGQSSRLFKDLREKQKLAYEVNSKVFSNRAYGQIMLTIKTSDMDKNIGSSIEKSIIGFEKHIKALMKKPVTEQELESAKKILTSAYIELSASAFSQNDLIYQWLYKPEEALFMNKFLEEIEKITVKDVQAAAKKHFSKPSVISILTNKEAAEKSMEFFKSRGKIEVFKE